ncbi:unnamed protein product (macronuclear) [Paramecium tetraurelia]|uniref:Uncharacterized protein n=1 Tax=Paramecium tetraurelia TaxID=5888 RepID=A0BNX7_PARTE|nr:uncharacterized protein GSPATT00030883001 [Paramecium tetraurelia]CAK60244.1 unnamed protein product [Paramecium tetraurelia]|eukprot:XP_001427642.1 hypothetical protein (macronuclear) [Paramecium tetraurelia strain d4-2]
MKSSHTNSNLTQFEDNYNKMNVLSARTNKLGLKSQMPQKESRQFSHHVDGKQRKQIKVKNLLVITDDQKLFHKVQESIQSYRSPKNCQTIDEECPNHLDKGNKKNSRMLSPKEQNEMIEYLQRKNEELVQENKEKQQLINRLLGSGNGAQKIKKIQSPKSQLTFQSIPKSADARNRMETDIRLPVIRTPERILEQRQDKQIVQNENQRSDLLNLYNMSFGKQINLNEDKKEQLELTSNQHRQTNPREKMYSQPNQPLKKNHFSKVLLKLPQEFHLEVETQKRQL